MYLNVGDKSIQITNLDSKQRYHSRGLVVQGKDCTN